MRSTATVINGPSGWVPLERPSRYNALARGQPTTRLSRGGPEDPPLPAGPPMRARPCRPLLGFAARRSGYESSTRASSGSFSRSNRESGQSVTACNSQDLVAVTRPHGVKTSRPIGPSICVRPEEIALRLHERGRKSAGADPVVVRER